MEALRDVPKVYLQTGIVAICFSLYLIGLVVYRLFLSPIANIPGPKLTAVTGWYETYCDVYKGGRFIFEIERWHQQYGPIVRINPWEVHFADPDFYDVLYSSKSRYSKIDHLKYRFGTPTASFDTTEHGHHAKRRGAMNPFFSRQRILNYSSYAASRVERLCKRLETEYKGTSKVLCFNDAWASLTTDVINYYSFAISYDFQDYPDFVAPFTKSIKLLAQSLHLVGHFPWILSLLQSLPESVVGILNPAMVPVFQFQNEITAQIKRIVHEGAIGSNNKTTDHKTVFSEMLKSDLPKAELSIERLKHEALSITGGGVDTIKNALVTASYGIISNPAIYKRLHDELVEAMPDINGKPPTVPELERLPYLNAIVQECEPPPAPKPSPYILPKNIATEPTEYLNHTPNLSLTHPSPPPPGLRLSYGITQRLTRIDPNNPIVFQNYTIPPNTPFSMTSYIQHRDPLIFPSPETFNPDRWLPPSSSSSPTPTTSSTSSINPLNLNPTTVLAPATGRPLSKYLVPFGRGPRACLGQNFAMAELFLDLGMVFRRFEFELYETGEAEVKMVANFFAPFPESGTKGVRVRVKG
ncbi:MAG: hypothetical protein Q9166_005083 [cf. Caloplaca sp. 2 TL-2023]